MNVSASENVSTTLSDSRNETVEKARADLLALAQDLKCQETAWDLACVVIDAVAALRKAAETGSNDTEIGYDTSVQVREEVLVNALNDGMHRLARYPHDAFGSYMAGVRACDRMDSATEYTRRQLNEMWIPSPYRPMNYANSVYGPYPAEPSWPPSKTKHGRRAR